MRCDPLPPIADHHAPWCDCATCEPAGRPVDDHLTGGELARLALAGAVFGTSVAFVLDPAGAAHALRDAVLQLLGAG